MEVQNGKKKEVGFQPNAYQGSRIVIFTSAEPLLVGQLFSFLRWAHSYQYLIGIPIYSENSDAASMLNFTSFVLGKNRVCDSVCEIFDENQTKWFQASKLGNFFLTKYTMIHKCYFRTNLPASYIFKGKIALLIMYEGMKRVGGQNLILGCGLSGGARL